MRTSHKVIALRFYDMNPEHQRNLQWLDGLSGQTLQQVMQQALAIGLPQVLAEDVVCKTVQTWTIENALIFLRNSLNSEIRATVASVFNADD